MRCILAIQGTLDPADVLSVEPLADGGVGNFRIGEPLLAASLISRPQKRRSRIRTNSPTAEL